MFYIAVLENCFNCLFCPVCRTKFILERHSQEVFYKPILCKVVEVLENGFQSFLFWVVKLFSKNSFPSIQFCAGFLHVHICRRQLGTSWIIRWKAKYGSLHKLDCQDEDNDMDPSEYVEVDDYKNVNYVNSLTSLTLQPVLQRFN